MELLPSLMCCAFKTCHATQSVGLLFSCAAEMISRGFVCWLSPDEAPKSESFEESMTQHYIMWKPMGSMSKQQESLSSVHYKKKWNLLARKCLKQFMHPGISHHIPFVTLAFPCLRTTQIENIHHYIFCSTQPDYILKLWEASHLWPNVAITAYLLK